MDSLRGHLLVASPALLDPNFRRTVVLVTEHNEDGAAEVRVEQRRRRDEEMALERLHEFHCGLRTLLVA